MAKKKEVKKRAPKPKKEKKVLPPAAENEQPEAPASEPENEAKGLPFYENARVLEILQHDTPEGWHHCRMSDGTTKHVPVSLFE